MYKKNWAKKRQVLRLCGQKKIGGGGVCTQPWNPPPPLYAIVRILLDLSLPPLCVRTIWMTPRVNLVLCFKIVCLKLNFVHKLTQNPMVMFTFPVFDWKYTFWAYFVQKIKDVNYLLKNLLTRLIWISKIQCSLSLFFQFLNRNNSFG